MSDEKKIENLIANSSSPEVLITPENIATPEKLAEKPRQAEVLPKPEASMPTVKTPLPNVSSKLPRTETDTIVLHKVESILADGMEKVYLSMDAATQATFKAKGEETSKKISNLLKHTKVHIKQVINLIVDWLRIVPKVNKYYIEQEAKIKADAIMEIYNKNKS